MFANDLEEICSGIARRHITDSHEWIEQLMLLYNREAAKLLRASGAGVLRRHAGKFHERNAAYEAAGLPADRLAVAAGEYCLASSEDTRHCGLGADLYCHASSPIRRWADCVNQLIMMGVQGVPHDVDQMNARSKAIKAYERDLIFMNALLGGTVLCQSQDPPKGGSLALAYNTTVGKLAQSQPPKGVLTLALGGKIIKSHKTTLAL